jgi:hypothetical protein
MPLKYQSEIDNFKVLISCPEDVANPEGELTSYRFCFSPIGHKHNFLPNVVFDRANQIPFNYDNAPNHVKCNRCGASFYTKLESIKKTWNILSAKIKENLGYTHIAEGILTKDDGLMKAPDKKGHFTFYEDANANLPAKFNLIEEL